MNAPIVAVLLVEDSRTDAVLLQESLLQYDYPEEGGFRFTLAESWAEAITQLQKLTLRLPRKTVVAHGSCIPREPYDFHHVAKAGVASPHTFKPRNAVTLAIEVSSQFSDNDHGFTE